MFKPVEYYGRNDRVLCNPQLIHGSLGIEDVEDYTWHTVTENPATLNNLRQGKLHTALSVFDIYGYSKQDGTPSYSDPVPIVSAGDGGALTVSVTDGNSKSQSLVLSTPGGLLGIPVESNGNITIDNQEYISDYIDMENGTYVHRIGVKNFSDEIIDKMNGLTFRKTDGGFELGADHNSFFPFDNQAMCNILAISHNDVVYRNSSGFVFSKQWISLPAGYASKADYLMFFLNNQVYINYVMESPVETAVSTAELEVYRALVAYTPKTMIQISDNAGLDITYKALASK